MIVRKKEYSELKILRLAHKGIGVPEGDIMSQGKVFILAAKRTALGSFLGKLSDYSAPELLSECIKDILQKTNVPPQAIQDLISGEVLQAGVGQAPARQAGIYAGLPKSFRALTINKVCGSGLKAIELIYDQIRLKKTSIGIGAGMESMSNAPFLMKGVRQGYKYGNQNLIDGMIHDGLWDPYNNFHMGNAGELCAKEFQFTRAQQDEFATASFKRAQASKDAFMSEIVPITHKKLGVINQDEGPTKVDFEKMLKLKPAFDSSGTITAANASSLNDGASAVLIGDEESSKKYQPLAEILGFQNYSQEPQWFTTSPTESIRRLLEEHSLKVSDIAAFEINEAFAVVPMHSMKLLGIPHEKVNVRGGAISLGHPIGCSGARIVTTLTHILKSKELGVASLCIGGGEAISCLIRKV